jgi:hypothetical protein
MTRTTDTTHTSMSQVWLDVISAVDYLSRGDRHGLTVYDAVEEALRWHTATLLAGGDEFLAAAEASQVPWDDPDPLRSALERLVIHHPPAVDDESTTPYAIHHALKLWVDQMADEYNDGHKWVHPRPGQPMPSPLMLPFETGIE